MVGRMRAKVNQPAGLLVSKKRRTKVSHYPCPEDTDLRCPQFADHRERRLGVLA